VGEGATHPRILAPLGIPERACPWTDVWVNRSFASTARDPPLAHPTSASVSDSFRTDVAQGGMHDSCHPHPDQSRVALWSDGGYTLAEIAVAMTIAGIVLAGAYATYAFVSSRIAAWQQQTAIENAAHRTLRELSSDIRSSVKLRAGPNDLRITLPASSVFNEPPVFLYTRSPAPSHRLLRNGVPLHDPSVSTLCLDVRARPAESSDNEFSSTSRVLGQSAQDRSRWTHPSGGDRLDAGHATGGLPTGMRCARAGAQDDAYAWGRRRDGETERETEGQAEGDAAEGRRPLYDIMLHLATRQDTVRVCTSVRPRSPETWPDVTLGDDAAP